MFNDKLYLTHITNTSCRSYLLKNTKQALEEWYKDILNISIPEGFWEDIETCGMLGYTRRDNINNVSVAITG